MTCVLKLPCPKDHQRLELRTRSHAQSLRLWSRALL